MSDGDGDCREEKERERREQSKDGDEEWERRGSRDSDKRPVRQMEEDWIRTRERREASEHDLTGGDRREAAKFNTDPNKHNMFTVGYYGRV